MLGCYTGRTTGQPRKRESSLNGGESDPDYVSYLLRMWRESGAGGSSVEEDKPVWRASVLSAATGKRRGFASLDDLFGFLRGHESTMLDRHPNHDQGKEARGALDTTAT
jgi:hypothetical protein